VWRGLDEITAAWREDRVFEPQRPADEAEAQIEAWHAAVEKA